MQLLPYTGSVVVETAGMVEMVEIEAFRGLDFHKFEFEPASARFQELKRYICELFKIGKYVDVVISYYDNDGSGDWIRLSCEEDLEMALRHLGEEKWYLQIIVAGDHPWKTHHDIRQQDRPGLTVQTSSQYKRWDPPLKHDSIYSTGGRLSGGPIGQSLWDNEPDPPRERQMTKTVHHSVYRHFGTWKPKVEKRDNCTVKTYGLVGFEVYRTEDKP